MMFFVITDTPFIIDYEIICGVPQGSILRPLIFILYMLLLGGIRSYTIFFQLCGWLGCRVSWLQWTDLHSILYIKSWVLKHFYSLARTKLRYLSLVQRLRERLASALDHYWLNSSQDAIILGVIFRSYFANRSMPERRWQWVGEGGLGGVCGEVRSVGPSPKNFE